MGFGKRGWFRSPPLPRPVPAIRRFYCWSSRGGRWGNMEFLRGTAQEAGNSHLLAVGIVRIIPTPGIREKWTSFSSTLSGVFSCQLLANFSLSLTFSPAENWLVGRKKGSVGFSSFRRWFRGYIMAFAFPSVHQSIEMSQALKHTRTLRKINLC